MSTDRVGENPFLNALDRGRPYRRAALAVGGAVAWATTFVGGGVAGSILDPQEVRLGPHEAEVSLNFDGEATFDLGPLLGEGILPMDVPLNIGTDVDVKSVPLLPGVDSESPTEEFIQQYASLVGGIDNDIEAAKNSVLQKFLIYGGLAATSLTVASGAIYASYGERRRQELRTSIKHHRDQLWFRAGVGTLAVATLTASGLAVATQETSEGRDSQPVAVGSLFADTSLESSLRDLKVTGPLATLMHDVAPRVLDAYDTNEQFYDQMVLNLEEAFAIQRTLRPIDSQHMILFYSDFHCNVGMARVIGALARLSQATIVIDAGDTTMSGTTFESPCVRILANAIPRGVDKVVAPGNHDSPLTEDQYRDNGFLVLDGDIKEVNGLRILGDADPMRSMIGNQVRQAGAEDYDDVARRLRRIACSQAVDVIVTHTPRVAAPTLANDCAPLGLSGHAHQQKISLEPLHIVADNASGAHGDSLGFGPLQTSTGLYLLKASLATGQPSYFQAFNLHPDASVTVHEPLQLPTNSN